jgi:hypothetical protein
MKTCTVCNVLKPLNQFRKFLGMKDGHLNQCKKCVYEQQKMRRATPEGRLIRKKEKQYPEVKRRYKQSEKGKAAIAKYKTKPEKMSAMNAVKYAIRKGRLTRGLCKICGSSEVEAHHWSYLKEHRLDVIWLCRYHHNEEHRKLDGKKSWV